MLFDIRKYEINPYDIILLIPYDNIPRRKNVDKTRIELIISLFNRKILFYN